MNTPAMNKTLARYFEAACAANLPEGTPPRVLDLLELMFYAGASAMLQATQESAVPAIRELADWYVSKGATLKD